MWIYDLGLNRIAIKNANIIAALIPAAVISNIPRRPPSIPSSFILTQEACARECPKLVIGNDAPTLDIDRSLSYMPPIFKKAPMTTNKLVICPGESLLLSYIIWATIHIRPHTIKAIK